MALMKLLTIRKTIRLRIAVVESDPLRLIGFRALLEPEEHLELVSLSLPEIAIEPNIGMALIGERFGHDLFDTISDLKMKRPKLPVIVVGSNMDDKVVLKAIISGAKGYVFEGATGREFAQAIRAVSEGSVWVPRRVLSMFIELVSMQRKGRMPPRAGETITDREKQVLEMLVAGLSNKEIARPLGIGERTVKAHVGAMMHKLRVHNRIELSVHALTHSLVPSPANQ